MCAAYLLHLGFIWGRLHFYTSSTPGAPMYLHFNLLFFLILSITSLIFPYVLRGWSLRTFPFHSWVPPVGRKESNPCLHQIVHHIFPLILILRSVVCTRMVRTVPGSVYICLFSTIFYTLPAKVIAQLPVLCRKTNPNERQDLPFHAWRNLCNTTENITLPF